MQPRVTFSLLLISALVSSIHAGTPAYAQAYRVTDLGPAGTVAAAINNAGQVTGSTPVGTPYSFPHTFLSSDHVKGLTTGAVS